MWLHKEVKSVYLCLHLDWKSKTRNLIFIKHRGQICIWMGLVHFPTLLLACGMALKKWPVLSEPQFPHLLLGYRAVVRTLR